MNNFIFENPTKVFFGKGCVKEYLACLTKGCDTILLAYGEGSVRKNGVYDEVTAILKEAGKNIVTFSGIMPNPTYAKVLECAKLAKENQAEMILGVGGGSVMDCCKAVSIAARYEGNVWADFFARPGIFDFVPLPLGVIVTAAGTGSECNGRAVITNEEMKIKTGRDYPNCNHGAGLAVLKPSYYRHIYKSRLVKWKRFAVEIWGICPEGKTEKEIACAGIASLERFIKEIGLPATLRELGVDEHTNLKQIADYCMLASGSGKK